MADDPTAKDLVKWGEIEPRDLLGQRTIAQLFARKWWRPAGCSARFFKKMGTKDPFKPPKGLPKPPPRPVHAASRFVRLDKHNKRKKNSGLPPWLQKIRAEKDKPRSLIPNALKKAKAQAEKAKAKAPSQVHTPSFGASPDAPLDRTPPRIKKDGTARSSARVPQRAKRVPTVVESAPLTAAGEIDRRPPRVLPQAAPAQQTRTRRQAGPTDPSIDRRPPKVGYVPTDDRGEALNRRKKVPQRKAAEGVDRRPPKVAYDPNAGPADPFKPRKRHKKVPEGLDRRPPRITDDNTEGPKRTKVTVGGEPPGGRPPEKKKDAPVRRAPKTGGGLDDLFGGADEGRVRLGRRSKPSQTEPEIVASKPTVDRTPPKIDRTPPKIDRTPPKIEQAPPDAPDEAPSVTAAPAEPSLDDLFAPAPKKKVNRKPPSRGGSGGMDDLFGGMQEGRVRLGRRKRPAPESAEPKAAPKKDAVDRTPPKFDLKGKDIPKG